MAIGVIQGFDSESKTSPKTGKRFTVHKVNIDGTWYEAGYSKPSGVGIGEVVQFESEFKFGKQQLVGGLTRTAGTPTPPSATTTPPAVTGGRGPDGLMRDNKGFIAKEFPVPMLHPDRSIIRQNALAHATKLYTAYQEDNSGAAPYHEISVTEAAGEVIEIARLFEAYSTGMLDVMGAASDGSSE